MTSIATVVHSNPDILGGAPVFVGTRVPVRALIDYLGGGQPGGAVYLGHGLVRKVPEKKRHAEEVSRMRWHAEQDSGQ